MSRSRVRPSHWAVIAISGLVTLLGGLLALAAGERGGASELLAEPELTRTTASADVSPPVDIGGRPAGAPTSSVDIAPIEPPLPATATPSSRPAPAVPPAAPPRQPPAPPPPAPRPPTVTSYEAEAPGNDRGGTRTFTCSGCSGNKKVGNIGAGRGSLQFNGVTATNATATVTLVYVNGESTRRAQLSVNGGPARTFSFPGTGGWSTTGVLTVSVPMRAGSNTLRLFNDGPAGPDFDRIIVSVPG